MTQVPQTWTSKDPEAVADYSYRIALDASDSVSVYDFEKLSGDVVIDNYKPPLEAAPSTDSDGVYGQDVAPIWLSGGTDGETAVFRVSWTTTGGRTDDAIILLPVAANEPVDLVLTGHMKPSAAHLIIRYPVFADVPVSTIRHWLADAERIVTDSWIEGDYAAALMALAAHNMASAGLGTEAQALSGVPTGITRFKSGSLEVGFTEQAANARAGGGYDSTRYGAEFAILLRRNRGGPIVQATGTIPYYPYPGYPHGAV